jgi:hypothetical protein
LTPSTPTSILCCSKSTIGKPNSTCTCSFIVWHAIDVVCDVVQEWQWAKIGDQLVLKQVCAVFTFNRPATVKTGQLEHFPGCRTLVWKRADASLLPVTVTVTVLLQALCHQCQAIHMRLKISNSAAHCCPQPPQSNFNDFSLQQFDQKKKWNPCCFLYLQLFATTKPTPREQITGLLHAQRLEEDVQCFSVAARPRNRSGNSAV